MRRVAAVGRSILIFNYLHDPVGQVRSNLLLAGAKQVLSGSPIVKRGPAVPFLLEPLQALAIYEPDGTPALDFPAALRARGRKRLQALGLRGRPMAVHPGSGSPTKNWPAARFVEILRRLQAAGRETLAVLGEASRGSRRAGARVPEMPVLAGLTLTELAHAGGMRRVLGNDSASRTGGRGGAADHAIFARRTDGWRRATGRVTVLRAPEKELERLTVAPCGPRWRGLIWFAPRAGGAYNLRRTQEPLDEAGFLLRHDADLLRERSAAHRPRLHDGAGGRAGALPAPVRARRLVPDGHRRARPEGAGSRRQARRRSADARRQHRAALPGSVAAPRNPQRRLHPHDRAAPQGHRAGNPAGPLRPRRNLSRRIRRLVLRALRAVLHREGSGRRQLSRLRPAGAAGARSQLFLQDDRTRIGWWNTSRRIPT
jgi:hypothetical protein